LRLFLLIFVLNLGNVFEEWHQKGGDLGGMIEGYLKNSPPYKEDYVKGLLSLDILSEVDSANKERISNSLYENVMGNCTFSRDFPDELKLFSIECYLDNHMPDIADTIMKSISNVSFRCMARYFIGKYYMSFNNPVRGKEYLKKNVMGCKGVVPIWSRDVLFGIGHE